MNIQGRKYVIIVFIVLVGIIYLVRLFYMQVVDDTWVLRAQEIAEKRKEIMPPRAVIYDRNGEKVVTNRTYYNLMMTEKDITQLDTIAFAKLIGWTPEQVKNRFLEIREKEGYDIDRETGKRTKPRYQKVRSYAFMKELTSDEIARIAPHLDDFPGFYEQVTSMRNYPYANAANILGYMAETRQNEIDEDPFYRRGDYIGRTGIERFYEKELRGQKGIKYVVTSALNNAISSYANGKYDTIAKQAQPLTLGVDITLQAYGEKLMQNKKGCIVAIEPESGEILTMVSAPSYDPNLMIGEKGFARNYGALELDPNKPLYPRPLAAEYPPGSIFKLLQALIGLQEGVLTPETGFPCTKSLVGCHNHPSPSSVIKGVQYSCNPYFYYATRKIIQQGKSRSQFEDAETGLGIWSKYMHSFGLGQRFDTDITGQRPGLIPDPAYYDKRYGHHRWAFSTIYSIAIGQGEVMLTPLQMANVAALLANRGFYYTPHFVKSIGDDGPLEQFRKKHYTMVESRHFDPVVEGMRRVVNEAGGTASRARLKDIVVCGKTGTVQNPHGEDHSVFLAFAPMDKPKIAIVVFIENAGFGGTWAAPTASLMIEKYLTGKITDEAKEKRILDAKLSNIE